jgi:hypothetical protein
MAKQILRADEVVRLVVPLHIVWGRGWEHAHEGSIVMDRYACAHVARVSFTSKTVCGRSVGEYWRSTLETWMAASLREEWEKSHQGWVDLEGTRLSICEYCYELVVYGKRFRHAAKEYWIKPDDDAPLGLDIKIVTRRLDPAELEGEREAATNG